MSESLTRAFTSSQAWMLFLSSAPSFAGPVTSNTLLLLLLLSLLLLWLLLLLFDKETQRQSMRCLLE